MAPRWFSGTPAVCAFIMAVKTEKPKGRVTVEVSDDKLEAWVKVSAQGGDQPPSPEEVVATLKAEGIVMNEYVAERARALFSSMDDCTAEIDRFSIARGQSPVEGVNGKFLWDEQYRKVGQEWQGDDPINYYTLNSIVTVEEDAVIGTITRAVPEADGWDVYGRATKPNTKASEVELDQSVRLANDGSLTVFSKCAGKIVFTGGTLSIDEVFSIKGDVDFESGNVDSCVNVDIGGNIGDLFTVNSEKSITVGGAIEAAKVTAKGDVVVRGGILGRGKGAVEVGGDIVAKFCDEADLRAEGTIKIAREVMNSRIRCYSKVLAPRGSIIGGEVYARGGVEAVSLGSDANVPTSITLGIHPDILRQAAAIEAALKPKREACDRVRQAVQPLLANLKRLTATQKEQATELLFKADAAAAEIDEAASKREQMLREARADDVPYVLVSKVVHQGVTIRIGRRHTVFDKDVAGPIRIEKRKVDRVTEFVAVNQLTGSLTVLASSEVVEESLAGTPQSEG